MPRRNSPPTPGSTGLAPGSDMAESDFVILPRPSLDNMNHLLAGSQQQVDLQLQSQISPTVVNGSNNMVSVMQYDQLVTAARSMKEENNMLKDQLTDMMQTMEARTEEFLQMKTCNRQVTERCKEIRKTANQEVTRLRNLVKSLEGQVNNQTSQHQVDQQKLQAINETLIEKLSCLEAKVQQLETELKEKTEEVVVSFPSHESNDESSADTPVSLLTRLKRDIKDVQGTRADIKSNVADLEVALERSAAELKHFKQRADLLKLEKQDLLALNNELQTRVSMYSIGMSEESLAEIVGAVRFEGEMQHSAKQGDADDSEAPFHPPFSPRQAMQKSSVALQDVLVQLQSERDKVASLMEDLKREREDRNKIETTLMEQLDTSTGEHDIILETLTTKHREQMDELTRKLNELTVANQEPHHSMELKQQVRSLVFELQERESTLQQKEHSVTDLRAFNTALKSKIALYHDELEEVRKQDSHMIDTLREELQRQQGSLQVEKQRGFMERMKHEKLTEEYNQLFSDFDDLNRKFEELRTRSGQVLNAAAFRELAEQRDNLTAQLMSAEEAIGASEADLQKALSDLTETKAKLETIPVLEQQAEIYKNDFNAERAAREKAHAEREAMVLELQLLKEDNQRMQEELSSHAQTQLQQMQHRHGSSSGGGGGGSSAGLYEKYITPLFGSPHSERAYPKRYSQGSDEAFVMPSAGDVGVDVDQLGHGSADEAGTGVMSRGIAGHAQYPGHHGGYPKPAMTHPRCPKCQEEFPDIDTLQIHMLDCIQ